MPTVQATLPPLENATAEERKLIREFAELTVYPDQVHADVIPAHQRVMLALIRRARTIRTTDMQSACSVLGNAKAMISCAADHLPERECDAVNIVLDALDDVIHAVGDKLESGVEEVENFDECTGGNL